MLIALFSGILSCKRTKGESFHRRSRSKGSSKPLSWVKSTVTHESIGDLNFYEGIKGNSMMRNPRAEYHCFSGNHPSLKADKRQMHACKQLIINFLKSILSCDQAFVAQTKSDVLYARMRVCISLFTYDVRALCIRTNLTRRKKPNQTNLAGSLWSPATSE